MSVWGRSRVLGSWQQPIQSLGSVSLRVVGSVNASLNEKTAFFSLTTAKTKRKRGATVRRDGYTEGQPLDASDSITWGRLEADREPRSRLAGPSLTTSV